MEPSMRMNAAQQNSLRCALVSGLVIDRALLEGPVSESGVAKCPRDTTWFFFIILVFSPEYCLNMNIPSQSFMQLATAMKMDRCNGWLGDSSLLDCPGLASSELVVGFLLPALTI